MTDILETFALIRQEPRRHGTEEDINNEFALCRQPFDSMGSIKFIPTELKTRKRFPSSFSLSITMPKDNCRAEHSYVYTQVGYCKGKPLSIKVLKMPEDSSEIFDEYFQALRSVERVFTGLKHPFILKNMLTFKTDNRVITIRKYFDIGSLEDYILDNSRRNLKDTKSLFKQILTAVAYMHERGIAHRNLKPRNILIDVCGTIKICDPYVLVPHRRISELKVFRNGPIYFTAPELFTPKSARGHIPSYITHWDMEKNDFVKCGLNELRFTQVYRSFPDMWSLGVVLFSMLWGVPPFSNESYIRYIKGEDVKPRRQKTLGIRLPKEYVPADAQKLYKSLIQRDYNRRPSAKDILSHGWLEVPTADDLDRLLEKSLEHGIDDTTKNVKSQTQKTEYEPERSKLDVDTYPPLIQYKTPNVINLRILDKDFSDSDSVTTIKDINASKCEKEVLTNESHWRKRIPFGALYRPFSLF